jgi:hypothetical protein
LKKGGHGGIYKWRDEKSGQEIGKKRGPNFHQNLEVMATEKPEGKLGQKNDPETGVKKE